MSKPPIEATPTDIARMERGEMPTHAGPTNLLEAIVQVASTPSLTRESVEVLERMMAMQERLEARQRETTFMAALAELQAEMPMIHKGGLNTFTKNAYARREDIHVALQPLLKKYGFAFSFNEESRDGDMVRFSAKLSHRDGHFEIKYKTLSTDKAALNSSGKPTRTSVQDDGSTASYALRYLEKMHLNIVETSEDDDGNGGSKPITEEQVKQLVTEIAETGMDMGRFMAYMHVGEIKEIVQKNFRTATNYLDVKRRKA